MIKAIIEHKNEGTVEIALPQSIRGMAEKLLSVGISKKTHDIRVSDTEKDDIRVRFTSDDTVGTHLIRLFNERCSLEDANETQLAIQNTPVDVQERINEKLLSDKYTSIKQIPENIKQWSYICDDDMDCLLTARLQEVFRYVLCRSDRMSSRRQRRDNSFLTCTRKRNQTLHHAQEKRQYAQGIRLPSQPP